MAVGDATVDNQSIASAAVLDIQPSGTVEYVIHNIYHEYDVDLQWYDGTNAITFASVAGAGSIEAKFHCTNSKRIRVKNTHGSAAKRIGYDGIVTHA